jgi:hypothetical protein
MNSDGTLPYAETVNYWQTGRSSPDVWLERATRQIESAEGVVLAEAFGKDSGGRQAYLLVFQLGMDKFRLVWPVLPTKTGNMLAARIQAATLLYHDVKARCMTARVLGTRAAFFSYLLLPDGRTATEVAAPDLLQHLPALLSAPMEG